MQVRKHNVSYKFECKFEGKVREALYAILKHAQT